ncbi:SMI1/KNR4 family protein [Bacteroides sp. 519]|uniref:SMI1/KNR4 family protein n=1 Tax=Bacteroides sp. 519 TaxID=2302937 RepID=UPI0013D5A915|nr:SMI1/KNR4 family protein [Bacteroides sp. 519]
MAKNTDSFLEVFGAQSHQYRLDPPVDIKEVEAFERKYNISLPEGYKVFLTQVGNGGIEYKSQVGNSGAGPDYGIFKLGHKRQLCMGYSLKSPSKHLAKEPFFNLKTTNKDWESISENIPEDNDEEYERAFERVYAGILTIGACGCSGYMGIMLNGESKGRVVYIYDELEYCPQFASELNFLDWYENWLDTIISGKRIGLECKPYKTEEESFARLMDVENVHKDNVPYWKMVALEYIRTLNELSPKYLKLLWESYNKETDEIVKLYMLNILVKFDYENTTAELDTLYETNPLEFLKILHLYAKDKKSDWQSIIEKLQKESSNVEVREYVDYIIRSNPSLYL